MKKISVESSVYKANRRVWEMVRSTKNDAYQVIWGCCRCIAEYVAMNDEILCRGIRLSDVGKMAEINKSIFDHIDEAHKQLKLYEKCRKRESALTKRYKFIP